MNIACFCYAKYAYWNRVIYSSRDAYIVDRRLYARYGTVKLHEKYNIPVHAIPDVSAKQIWARNILLN